MKTNDVVTTQYGQAIVLNTVKFNTAPYVRLKLDSGPTLILPIKDVVPRDQPKKKVKRIRK